MHLGNIESRLEGLNNRLKYCWPKVIYFIYRPNELELEIKKKNWGTKQKSGKPWPTQAPP